MDTRPRTRPDDDTAREALRRQFAALRRLSARERLALMADLTGLVRAMTREGLRRLHPNATEPELDVLFADRVLGRELAEKVREHRRNRSKPAAQ